MQITNAQPDIRFYPNGDILIRKHVSEKLNISHGDAINIIESNGETLLCVQIKSAPPSFKGIAKSKGGAYFRVRWRALTKRIIPNGSSKAYYRVGEPLTIDGKVVIPIITRINYATTNQI